MRKLAMALMLACAFAFLGQQAQAAQINSEYKTLAKKLFYKQKQRKGKVPPLAAGQIRLKGSLISLSASGNDYYYKDLPWAMSCRFTLKRFGALGMPRINDNGFAWFFADIDAETSEIVRVYVYGIGDCSAHHQEYFAAFLLAKKLKGSFGKVSTGSFTLQASGKGIMDYSSSRDELYLARDDFIMIITGRKNILEAKNGAQIPIKFYFGNLERGVKTDRNFQELQDQGSGTATVERADAPGKGQGSSAAPEAWEEAPAQGAALPFEAMMRDKEKREAEAKSQAEAEENAYAEAEAKARAAEAEAREAEARAKAEMEARAAAPGQNAGQAASAPQEPAQAKPEETKPETKPEAPQSEPAQPQTKQETPQPAPVQP